MELKVGDIIYRENYGKITGVYTVDRLTKTLAICKDGSRFNREYSLCIIKYGDTGRRNTGTYNLKTPELENKLYKQNAIAKIRGFRFEDLSLDQVRNIMAILF